MPGSATDTLEAAVLAHTLGYGTLPVTTQAFIALCLAAPAPSATTAGAEVAGGGYVRRLAAFAAVTPPQPAIAGNMVTIEYPAATAGWGSLGFFEVWTAITGGVRLYWGPLVDPLDGVTPITRTVMTGDIVRFSAGVIQVQAT